MDNSDYLCANKAIKCQVYDSVIEEKNDSSTINLDINNKNLIKKDNPSTTNFDITNKILIINDIHSKNSGIITKEKKMNEYENIKSEKIIESIKSLYILKNIFSFLSKKKKLEIIIYNKDKKI